MKKQIELIEIFQEKNVVKFHIQSDCGFTQDYFAKEVLNFFVENELIKKADIGVYRNEPHGTIDFIHWFDKGLDTEKRTIEVLKLDEFVDENYSLFEWFLDQRSLSLKN
jgi:hypothetical protein